MGEEMKQAFMTHKSYHIMKYLALVVLPGVATLYFALSQIWGLPYGAEIVGTITAIDTFLGISLGISTNAYNKSEQRFDGSVDIVETPTTKNFVLNIPGDPYELDKKNEIVLKINPITEAS